MATIIHRNRICPSAAMMAGLMSGAEAAAQHTARKML
jgi:hypothetical protein